jgi:pyruvate dehydrogenase E2 component (dihydrolipoamide acetyltransferase)
VVRDGEVVPGHVMTVTLSCDHRIVDGALAGRFLRELGRLLEAPLALVA